MLIETKKVTVKRQNKVILQDITLEIGKNDFTTIVGPNGAGKSMLLKCLMGFYKSDSGDIIKKPDLKIGYVPQKFVADATLPISVEAFLKLGNKISDIDFKNLLSETNITSIIDKQLSFLSGGEMQKVLLARSLVGNPELLILDEPAQNLDISGQLAFYKLLEKIYEARQLSILMVSHDLHMVMASTKKVICLFNHICCSGSPNIVTKDPEFIALFGNDMANMMAIYQHSHNHQHV